MRAFQENLKQNNCGEPVGEKTSYSFTKYVQQILQKEANESRRLHTSVSVELLNTCVSGESEAE